MARFGRASVSSSELPSRNGNPPPATRFPGPTAFEVAPMSASTTLLISTDPPLIESVRGVVRSVGDLGLRVQAEVEEACAQLERGGAALVLVHLPRGEDAGRATRLLQSATAGKGPVPVLVLSDRHDAAQALDLLRLGVADYLSRPLDLGRLACLVDMLTVRTRYE